MSKNQCSDIKLTKCHKFKPYCHLENLNINTKINLTSGVKRALYTLNPEYIESKIERTSDDIELGYPPQRYHYFKIEDPPGEERIIRVTDSTYVPTICRKIQGKAYDPIFYSLIKSEDLISEEVPKKPATAASAAAVLSEVEIPSPQKLDVSDLPKSNSGVAKTEQVMEQVMAANVSKGMLSRQKSVEILASPAAQQYTDLRVHLTQDEVRQLDADMTAVHDGVETILGQHLSKKDEKAALQALFDHYDLCQYVRTADDKKLTIPKLKAMLTSFGEVKKRVRQATTRSTICYIILSIVLMDPKTFIEKLAGINKGSYSKK